ncbi:MAG: hypothetical protein QMD86_01520 [Patescibacteria group bacterium]|nr:hypothetical protein [Patescibacteria group bacterium]
MIEKEQIEKLKNALEERKKFLESEIKRLSSVPDFGDDIDSGEEADESAGFGNQLALAQTFKEEVADIETAFNKIDRGKYGICEICKNEISFSLLETDPSSKMCRECKLNLIKE